MLRTILVVKFVFSISFLAAHTIFAVIDVVCNDCLTTNQYLGPFTIIAFLTIAIFWVFIGGIMENKDEVLILPKLKWPQNKRFKWAAWDSDGWVVFYTDKPRLGHRNWVHESGEFQLLPYKKNRLYEIPNIEDVWQFTLHKRR